MDCKLLAIHHAAWLGIINILCSKGRHSMQQLAPLAGAFLIYLIWQESSCHFGQTLTVKPSSPPKIVPNTMVSPMWKNWMHDTKTEAAGGMCS